jgi:hypothetical protein
MRAISISHATGVPAVPSAFSAGYPSILWHGQPQQPLQLP